MSEDSSSYSDAKFIRNSPWVLARVVAALLTTEFWSLFEPNWNDHFTSSCFSNSLHGSLLFKSVYPAWSTFVCLISTLKGIPPPDPAADNSLPVGGASDLHRLVHDSCGNVFIYGLQGWFPAHLCVDDIYIR
jgi:hypothetical protein